LVYVMPGASVSDGGRKSIVTGTSTTLSLPRPSWRHERSRAVRRSLASPCARAERFGIDRELGVLVLNRRADERDEAAAEEPIDERRFAARVDQHRREAAHACAFVGHVDGDRARRLAERDRTACGHDRRRSFATSEADRGRPADHDDEGDDRERGSHHGCSSHTPRRGHSKQRKRG
jgi:hypothetical protein